MASEGLARGNNGLRVHIMCEVPSNAILAPAFLAICDGLSIGSNDLTQLTLGVDRDSGILSGYDERDPAVLHLMGLAVDAGHAAGKYVGICGQAPSDFPEVCEFLVERGIGCVAQQLRGWSFAPLNPPVASCGLSVGHRACWSSHVAWLVLSFRARPLRRRRGTKSVPPLLQCRRAISLNPDSVHSMTPVVLAAERSMREKEEHDEKKKKQNVQRGKKRTAQAKKSISNTTKQRKSQGDKATRNVAKDYRAWEPAELLLAAVTAASTTRQLHQGGNSTAAAGGGSSEPRTAIVATTTRTERSSNGGLIGSNHDAATTNHARRSR